ncbi:insulin-like growth factor-binding protein 1 [Ambystoma mexicanum]|uniref:insulin-like growth factor-binding protein 1 n=1 Tax=Ambystoma mexicanum TaxID=8296 RepID=UPI0037E83A77
MDAVWALGCWLLCCCALLHPAGAFEPIRCPPCTEERVALCPPVPSECPELAREPACGCCLTCALTRGAPCGVYTARCGRGLSCQVAPGEHRPLHALLRGLGSCLDQDEAERLRNADAASDVKDSTEHEGTDLTQEQMQPNYRPSVPSSYDKEDSLNTNNAYERIKAKRLFERRKWKEQQGPCQKELYKTMDKLTKAQQRTGEEIYRLNIPNCNRNGFYHSKQCEPSLDGERGKCWCVYPVSGKRIPGSPELRGDPNCQQYLTVQE